MYEADFVEKQMGDKAIFLHFYVTTTKIFIGFGKDLLTKNESSTIKWHLSWSLIVKFTRVSVACIF